MRSSPRSDRTPFTSNRSSAACAVPAHRTTISSADAAFRIMAVAATAYADEARSNASPRWRRFKCRRAYLYGRIWKPGGRARSSGQGCGNKGAIRAGPSRRSALGPEQPHDVEDGGEVGLGDGVGALGAALQDAIDIAGIGDQAAHLAADAAQQLRRKIG